MGCDGGTIPKRKEIVKNKESQKKEAKEVELIHKWAFCAVSGESLRKPIVSSHVGDLMSKESAIEHLLEYKQQCLLKAFHLREDVPGLATFNSMKDIKELNLKEITENDQDRPATSSDTRPAWVQFCCPITGLEMNGKYKFMFSWQCGCVISERALREVPNDNRCIVCHKPYQEFDLVVINPDKKEFKENQVKMAARNMKKVFRKHGDKALSSVKSSSTQSSSCSPTKAVRTEARQSSSRNKRHKS